MSPLPTAAARSALRVAPSRPMNDEGTPFGDAASPRPRWLGATFRSLRHRNYRLYFFGQLVSLTGTWMQNAALTWLAFELTGRSVWPALLTACQLLPTFLLGAWGGAIADRIPKRRLLLLTQALLLILAFALAWMVYAGTVTPWYLLAIALANGLVVAIDLPARLAFVMEMAGREELMNAVALNSLLFNTARVGGPWLAGKLLLWLGPSLCFAANGLSYLAVLWALACMTVGLCPAPRMARSARSLRAGFAYLAERPALALLVAMSGVLAVCGWPVMALLPGLAQRQLGLHAEGYSYMLSAVGVGALLATLPVASFGSLARRRAFIGTGLACVSTALLGLSFVASLPMTIACCALLGFGLILFLATSQAIVQLNAADYNRGLIMGIWAMVQSGGVPLGNLLAGPAADRWGEAVTFRTQGIVCGLCALGLLALFSFGQRTMARS